MAEFNIPRAHSDQWYDQLAQCQTGYFYPWHSKVSSGDGEKAFMDLVFRHANKDSEILEVGCGHGSLALSIAGYCKHVTAYDRVAPYIELAEKGKLEHDVRNVDFQVHDARGEDGMRLPMEDNSVDMIIGRRAPLHWIDDAPRVCKSGAKLIFLSPMEEAIPAWSSVLPPKLHYENSGRHTGHGSIHESVENRLHRAGLKLHSGWSFDVPERFSEPQELYKMLSWGIPASEVPSYDDVKAKLDLVFEHHADKDGVELRHCRYLWYAIVP